MKECCKGHLSGLAFSDSLQVSLNYVTTETAIKATENCKVVIVYSTIK